MLSCGRFRHLSCFCDFRRLTPCGLPALARRSPLWVQGRSYTAAGSGRDLPRRPLSKRFPHGMLRSYSPPNYVPCGPKYALFGASRQRGWDLSLGGRKGPVRMNSDLWFGASQGLSCAQRCNVATTATLQRQTTFHRLESLQLGRPARENWLVCVRFG